MLVDGDHPLHRVDPAASGLADIGNFSIALGDIQKSLAEIERQAADIEHLVALGGDHGITLPLLRALAKRRGPSAVIHFDAHVDTWPENFGQSYAHGTVFYHAISEGLIAPRRMIQIGIRSPVERDHARLDDQKRRGHRRGARRTRRGPAAIAEQIHQVIGEAPVYLSFDIDVLDPAFAPGTGTPEVGGLATWQAQAIVRRLSGLHFIGMDMVEGTARLAHGQPSPAGRRDRASEYLRCWRRPAHRRAAPARGRKNSKISPITTPSLVIQRAAGRLHAECYKLRHLPPKIERFHLPSESLCDLQLGASRPISWAMLLAPRVVPAGNI